MALDLHVVTPEKEVFTDTVDTVSVPTTLGELGILPGHIPLLSLIEPGALKFSKGGKETVLAIDKGFVQVQQDKVSVLVEGAVYLQDIDLAELEKAQERAKASLEKAKNEEAKDPTSAYTSYDLEAFVRFSSLQQRVKTESLNRKG
jgi:F-type H+-transporting ATPase subunit epsilon